MPSNRSSILPKLGAVEPPKSEMLLRFERGEITIDEYMDFISEQAVEHLKGKVGPVQLRSIQTLIREQMTTDPAVVQYLQQATGFPDEPTKAS